MNEKNQEKFQFEIAQKSVLKAILFWFCGVIVFAYFVTIDLEYETNYAYKQYSSSSQSKHSSSEYPVSYNEAKRFASEHVRNINQRIIDSTPYNKDKNKEYLFLTKHEYNGKYCMISVSAFVLKVGTADCGRNAYNDYYGWKELAKSIYGY